MKINFESHRAGYLVRKALASGVLTKPENCEICGLKETLDAHHDDYSKPLEVKWLCRSCHKCNHSGISAPNPHKKRQHKKQPPRKKLRYEPYKVRIGDRVMWQVNLESTSVKRDDGSVARVRPRRTFASVEEAHEFANLKRIERKNHGAASISMPEGLRVAALRAAEMLRPLGEPESLLIDAVREYVERRQLSRNSQSVQNAVLALLKAKESDRVRPRYLEDLRSRLGRFARDFGERKVCDLTPAEIDSWLRNLGQAPISRNTLHLRLHTLFEYCRTQGWLTINPLADVPRARINQDASIGILSVEETARLLESADQLTLPYWLFSMFCGLRSAEVQRLEWKDVHWEERLVEVPSLKSKTASRRFVALRANLLEWLEPYRDARGPICPPSLYERLVNDREAAGISQWPPNAARHSFASYHLAHFRDPRELALEMGHTNSEVTFRHYRELVKPNEASRFWRIVPAISDAPKIAVVA
jgi:integrase